VLEILFVHPNFPGQFRKVAAALARQPGVRVVGVGDESWMRSTTPLDGVPVIGYPAPDGGDKALLHPWSRHFDAAVRRGEQVMNTLAAHKEKGLEPDVIVTHSGWGDAYFLRDFFPGTKVVGLFEYYYHARGADVGFDPEFPSSMKDIFRLRALNATQLMALDACDVCFCPTQWQRSRFPAVWQERLGLMHEGIDTQTVCPDATAQVVLPDGTTLKAGDEVLTFVSRNLEPYRGYHVFMRALSAILDARPNCHVVIVGADGAAYGPSAGRGQTYRERYLGEVVDELDMSRVHFTGTLVHADYVRVLQVSRLHVYLTYPFILSWSALEAMAAGCLVLASATPPVEEVITEGVNGLLFPFHSPRTLAKRAIDALAQPADYDDMRQAARQTIMERYDFETVSLPAYKRMIEI
jgi:glycosyltransferase involved in cell wall biosynthesis